MYEPGCVLTKNQFYVVNGAIYSIASYDFFVNRQTIVLHNKPITIALSSPRGFESSWHIP